MPLLGSEQAKLIAISKNGERGEMTSRETVFTKRHAVETLSELADIAVRYGLARGPRDLGIFLDATEATLDLGRPFTKDDIQQLIQVYEGETQRISLERVAALLEQFILIFANEDSYKIVAKPALEAYEQLAKYIGKKTHLPQASQR